MLKLQSNVQEELWSFLKLLFPSVIVLKCKDEGHNFNSRENKLEQQRLNIKVRFLKSNTKSQSTQSKTRTIEIKSQNSESRLVKV